MRRAGLALVCCFACASPLPAQQADPAERPALAGIATLDSEALFFGTRFGQRVQRDLERDRAALAAENRRIEAELIDEESALTQQRAAMSLADFAPLAKAFDAKVERIREEQELKARSLQDRLERERQRFLAAVRPILADLLARRDAAVVLDAGAVLFAADGIDITTPAVAAIDAQLGDGADGALAPPTQPRPAPE